MDSRGPRRIRLTLCERGSFRHRRPAFLVAPGTGLRSRALRSGAHPGGRWAMSCAKIASPGKPRLRHVSCSVGKCHAYAIRKRNSGGGSGRGVSRRLPQGHHAQRQCDRQLPGRDRAAERPGDFDVDRRLRRHRQRVAQGARRKTHHGQGRRERSFRAPGRSDDDRPRHLRSGHGRADGEGAEARGGRHAGQLPAAGRRPAVDRQPCGAAGRHGRSRRDGQAAGVAPGGQGRAQRRCRADGRPRSRRDRRQEEHR